MRVFCHQFWFLNKIIGIPIKIKTELKRTALAIKIVVYTCIRWNSDTCVSITLLSNSTIQHYEVTFQYYTNYRVHCPLNSLRLQTDTRARLQTLSASMANGTIICSLVKMMSTFYHMASHYSIEVITEISLFDVHYSM
jgi:hypothetical protein